MTGREDYGDYETAWCPGCGNFSILQTLKATLEGMGLSPQQIVMVSGIGQAAKTPHYLKCHFFNGLHGRALPAATGIKAANPSLVVIAESGDGDMYGEGGNHFTHTNTITGGFKSRYYPRLHDTIGRYIADYCQQDEFHHRRHRSEE